MSSPSASNQERLDFCGVASRACDAGSSRVATGGSGADSAPSTTTASAPSGVLEAVIELAALRRLLPPLLADPPTLLSLLLLTGDASESSDGVNLRHHIRRPDRRSGEGSREQEKRTFDNTRKEALDWAYACSVRHGCTARVESRPTTGA